MRLWESLGTHLGPKVAQVAPRGPFFHQTFTFVYRCFDVFFVDCLLCLFDPILHVLLDGLCVAYQQAKQARQSKQAKQSQESKESKQSMQSKQSKHFLYIWCCGGSVLHLSPEALGGKFCLSFNDSGSFSSLCSLYCVALSLSSALSGPLVSTGTYSGKRASSWRFPRTGFPLGKEWEGESPRGGERLPA